jgi:hypothetical protein
MFPHVLTLSLLFSPPSLASRLSLGVAAQADAPSAPFLGESAAAGAGVLLGHAVAAGLALAGTRLFRNCDGDVCRTPSEGYAGFAVGEVVAVPLLAAALAYAVHHDDQSSFFETWLGAACGHLIGSALVVPGVLLFTANNLVASVLIMVGLLADLVFTSMGASIGLHHSDLPSAPSVVQPPPLPPQLQPPPHAGTLILPIRLAF